MTVSYEFKSTRLIEIKELNQFYMLVKCDCGRIHAHEYKGNRIYEAPCGKRYFATLNEKHPETQLNFRRLLHKSMFSTYFDLACESLKNWDVNKHFSLTG